MEEERKEKIEEINEKVNEVMDMNLVESYIKDNIIPFSYEDKQYRVRRPSLKERNVVNELRIKKQVGMLKAKNKDGSFVYSSEEDLIKLYKERGVDLNELQSKMVSLQNKRNQTMLKLGKALKDKASEGDLKVYRDEIDNLKEELQVLNIEKTTYLEFSIEQQMFIFVYSYLTSMITEKKEDDKWVSMWKSYDEYLIADEKFINIVSFHAALIISNNSLT